ncbi:transposase, partial [Microseira wollei]
EVSVDMWRGFKKVITEVFPNAVIVIPTFRRSDSDYQDF